MSGGERLYFGRIIREASEDRGALLCQARRYSANSEVDATFNAINAKGHSATGCGEILNINSPKVPVKRQTRELAG